MKRSNRWLILGLTLWLLTGCTPGKKAQNQADIHYMLGVSNLRDRNSTDALKEFLAAEKIEPERADIQQALAQAYHLKKAYPEAEKHYLRALELSPDDPQIENNLAALYLDMQHWDDALRYFRKAAHNLLFATPEIALTGAGFADFQKGNYVDAIDYYQQAIKANPRYAQSYMRLGQVYYSMGKTRLGVEELQKAIDLVPDYVLAHYQLGLAYMKLKEPLKAAGHFKAVVQQAPDSEYGQKAQDYLKLLK